MASVTPGDVPLETFETADAVFVGGSSVALSPSAAETAGEVLHAADAGGAMTALDIDYQPGLWDVDEGRDVLGGLLEDVGVLFANEQQAKTVLNKTGQPRELVHTIASEGNFDMVVMTRSERGAIVCHDNVIHEQDGIECDAVDETGQHAAFVGAFLDRLLRDAPTDEALRYGVATASLARTVPGSLATVEPAEVEGLVDEMDR
ncbi:PfkB family carbohydrate kinase [Haloarculaceae archaeon H-GB2-1]|nr:PfkB family carbohydrate kinase [Haloarculaceae archaeon H-GB2-1]